MTRAPAPRDHPRVPRFGLRTCGVLLSSIGLVACATRSPAAEPTSPPAVAPDRPAPYTDGSEDEALHRVFAELDDARRRSRTPGVTYVVVRRGPPPVVRTQGVVDVASGAPVTASTRFSIASLTKAFTATLVLIARDRRLLDLDTHPRQCLEGFSVRPTERDRQLVLRDLLAHTTGHARDSGAARLGATRDELVQHVQTMDPSGLDVGRVGRRYHYSNAMVAVAAACAERALGGRFEELVGLEILAPLGMRDSGFEPRSTDARGHVVHASTPPRDGTPARPERFYVQDLQVLPATAGSGGLIASGPDMARWMAYWMDLGRGHPRILSKRSPAEAILPRLGLDERHHGYGLGWGIRTRFGRRAWTHSGFRDGQRSAIAIVPDDGVAVLVLSNGSHGRFVHQANRRLLAHVLGETAEPIDLGDAPAQRPDPVPPVVPIAGRPHPIAGLYLRADLVELLTPEPPPLLRIHFDGEALTWVVDTDDPRRLVLDADGRAHHVSLDHVDDDGHGAQARPGRGLTVIRDVQGRIVGLREDTGRVWRRLETRRRAPGAPPTVKDLRATVAEAHGWERYPSLLPVACEFQMPLPWFGVDNRGRIQSDREHLLAVGTWSAGPKLVSPWFEASHAEPARPPQYHLGWYPAIPPRRDPLALDARAGLDHDPVGWTWELAHTSAVIGRITGSNDPGAHDLDLVIHGYDFGHRILDAYDADTHRLQWRKIWWRRQDGGVDRRWRVYESWIELDGVLLPGRVREGDGGRHAVRTYQDCEARVGWAPNAFDPAAVDGLRPALEPVAPLSPTAEAALALPSTSARPRPPGSPGRNRTSAAR